MNCMTDHQIVQTRMSSDAVEQLDADRTVLGLQTRSAAIREGLRLLHKRARNAKLGQDYDEFYGTDVDVPVSDLAAVGDQIAADAISADG